MGIYSRFGWARGGWVEVGVGMRSHVEVTIQISSPMCTQHCSLGQGCCSKFRVEDFEMSWVTELTLLVSSTEVWRCMYVDTRIAPSYASLP